VLTVVEPGSNSKSAWMRCIRSEVASNQSRPRANEAAAYRPAASNDGTSRVGSVMRAGSRIALGRLGTQRVAHRLPRDRLGRVGDRSRADLDHAAHRDIQTLVRRVQAEVGDGVAEAVEPVAALVGARFDAQLVRQHALPRQRARRQVGELPRLRDRRAVGVARVVLDGVALDGHRLQATSDSTLRDVACEKNFSDSSSDAA
jgi:hypothetical protein